MSIRSLITSVGFLLSSITVVAQTTHFEPGYSWRNYLGTVTPPLCPDRLCHYYPTNSFDWRYDEFAAWRGPDANANNATSFMNFRVAFPLNYDPERPEPYPVILMLHGAGESGRIWDGRFDYDLVDPRYDNNSRNLLHGGNAHQQAANRNPSHPQAFPGIIIFPQVSYSGSWASGWQEEPTTNQEYIYEFLEYMVTEYNANINRIYVHGLSNGGRGTWDTSSKRPDLFAAILPMSGLPYNSDVAAARLETTPIRLYQGGLDTNPSPGGAESVIEKLETNGGIPEYILYPTLRHGVWNTAYGEDDFFSWMLAKDKRNIYIFGGSTELCANATKKLGFSYGMVSYQWKKDGIDIPGANTRYLTITGTGDYTGSYTVEFERPNGTTDTSFPVNITTPISPPVTPVLTVQGSLILPYTREDGSNIGSVGQTETRLYAPSGYPQYNWYKDGVLQGTTTNNNAKITHGGGSGSGSSNFNGVGNQNNAGNWTVRVLENSGCLSNFSNSLTLVYNSSGVHTSPTGGVSGDAFTGIGTPTAVNGDQKITLSWTDNCPDEEYLEIWRERRGSNGYNAQTWQAIAVVPANTTTYIDENGLRPQAQYRYSIRAIGNNDGRFSAKTTTNPYPSPVDDTTPPTPPGDLSVTDITESSISISWSPSSDNDVVYRYEVFNGSTSVASLTNDLTGDTTDGDPAPPTTYTFTGLDPATMYNLNVRAVDFRGNVSTFPEGVFATTNGVANGLYFNYYTTSGLSSPYLAQPGGFNFAQTPDETGITANFNNSTDLANQYQGTTGTGADNFVFSYDGFIQIDNSGIYTFYTRSDDGSRLYINGTEIVDNDGAHGAINQSGIFNFGSPGKYPIRVTFFENGGGNSLEVKYRQGDHQGTSNAIWNAASYIPDDKLFLTGTTLVTYYSNATGNLETLGTWGTNTDGSGSSPTSFTDNSQIFIITNRAGNAVTLSNAWTVSGTSSKVVVDENMALTCSAPLNAKVDANAGSTINLNHTTLPTLSKLDATSTVNMNVIGTIPQALYGNLNLKTSSTTKILPLSSTQVMGNLVVDDQVTLIGTTPNQSTISVSGDITFNGSSGSTPVSTERFTVVFKGNQAHTLFVDQVDVALYGLEVDYDGSVDFDFNEADPHTITIGVNNGSNGLLLRNGASMLIGNHTLVVNGVYGINPTDDVGEINIDGGNISITTSSNQTSSLYFADEVNTHNVNNLSISNTSSGQFNIGGPTNLSNMMTVGNGTVINMQGDFVLRSTSDAANGTARIGPLLNGAAITGNITAERYMSGEGRIYRYISSPVENVSAEDLQEFFPITGNFTGASTGGSLSGATSMWGYSEPNYTPFPASGGTNQETMVRGKGYSAFIREGSAATTWAVTGVPHQGNIPLTLTPSGGGENEGWNLVGNPYPSPIQWTGGSTGGWTLSGVNNTIYIRENTSAETGGFKSHNGSSGDFDGIIAPGQAFWVRTTNGSPQITISEAAKSVTDGSFYREAPPENTVEIFLRSGQAQDATFIQFRDPATPAFDTELDGVKQLNSGLNLSTLTSDGKPMVINLTTPHYCAQEVSLRIAGAAVGEYQLEINNLGSIISNEKVTLIDNFLNTESEIIDSESRTISITSDPASKADGRFVLRFEKPEVRLDMNLTSSPGCESTSARVNIVNAQPGVSYQAFYNGNPVSEPLIANSDYFELPLQSELLPYGLSEVSLTAGFRTCNNFEVPQTINVQRDTLTVPVISVESSKLVTNIGSGASYRWFFEETELVGQNGPTLSPDTDGNYVVEVTKGSCVKVSEPFTYLVTALENPETGVFHPYPNPTTGIIHLELNPSTARYEIFMNDPMGKQVQAEITRIGDSKVEINLSALPDGMYVLSANGYRYRIIKRK